MPASATILSDPKKKPSGERPKGRTPEGLTRLHLSPNCKHARLIGFMSKVMPHASPWCMLQLRRSLTKAKLFCSYLQHYRSKRDAIYIYFGI